MVRIPRIAPVSLAEHAICCACLVIVPLFVLSPAVFNGQFPLDTDSLYYSIPWEEAQPKGLPTEDPGGPRGIIEQFYPEFLFLNDAALAGDSVQWNPREGYGVPHLAQWRTRALSPFSIPFYFFDLRIAMTLSLLAKLVVAGLAAFLTARVLWLRPAAALLVGLAYQLSPVFLLAWHAPMSDTVAWFPFLLIMFERLGSGRTRVWPASAMVFALMLLGGDPESVIAVLMLGVVYVFTRSFLCGRGIRRAVTPAIVLIISVLAGAAMTAAQLLPFAEWLRYAEPAVAPTDIHELGIADAVMSILPNWYGAPDVGSLGGAAAHRVLVVGFLFLSAPLILAFPYWFAMRRELAPVRRPFPDSVVAITIVSIVLGLVVALLGTVTIGFLRFSPAHFWFPITLWAAVVLGRSGEDWSRLLPDPCQDALKRFLMMVPVVVVVWLVAVLVSESSTVEVSRVIQFVAVCAIAIVFIVAVTVTALRPHAAGFSYVCATLVAIPLIYAFGSAQPFRSSEEVFPRTETIAAFDEASGRVGGGEIAAHWPLAGNRISYAALREGSGLSRHHVFNEALQEDPALLARTGLNRLALRDVDLEGTFAPIRDQVRIDRSFSAGVFWVEMMNPVPRARLIYANRPVPMDSELPIASAIPPVVEGGPVLLETEPSQGEWGGVYAAIDNPNVFDIDAAAPAVLVINEAWYPGWRAFVDGTETDVTPVDAIFRGVPISSGTHRVELFFDSQPYRIGRGISLMSTLVVVIAFIGRISTAIRKRRRLR